MGTAIVSRPKLKTSHFLVFSRLSDSRAQEEERKNEGRLEARPPGLPGVQFNSFPTDHRALLPECLEKATVVATAFVN